MNAHITPEERNLIDAFLAQAEAEGRNLKYETGVSGMEQYQYCPKRNEIVRASTMKVELSSGRSALYEARQKRINTNAEYVARRNAKLLKLHNEGMSVPEMAATIDLSPTSIARALKNAGITPHPAKITRERAAARKRALKVLREQYAAGATLKSMAEQAGVSVDTLRLIIRDHKLERQEAA